MTPLFVKYDYCMFLFYLKVFGDKVLQQRNFEFMGGSAVSNMLSSRRVLSNFEFGDFSLPFGKFKSHICYIRVVRIAFELLRV